MFIQSYGKYVSPNFSTRQLVSIHTKSGLSLVIRLMFPWSIFRW